MTEFDFDAPVERRGTNSLKYDGAELLHRPGDTMPLWVADMDFRAPDPVIEAIVARARHGVFGYTFVDDGYRQAVRNWMADRHAWDIQADWIVAAPGVVYALAMCVRAFTEPGDAVVVQPPVYYPFFSVVRNNGRKLVESPLVFADGVYRMDFAGLERAIEQSGARMLILCNPHNPVGRVWREDELRRLADMCLSHGVTIVSDEIHMDFARSGQKHVPIASLSREIEQASITLTSASKTFNLAGLQAANAIIPNARLRADFSKAIADTGYGEPNVLALEATRAAYEHGASWLDALKAYLEGNWLLLRDTLERRIPAVSLVEAEGTYLAWIDCRSLQMEDAVLKRFMLEVAKLWLDQGDMFGAGGSGFVRINLATQRATLAQALERLEKAVCKVMRPGGGL